MSAKNKLISISVFADTTNLYTEEEIQVDNLTWLNFPEHIVESYAKKFYPELPFDKWLDEYCADWTDGLYEYAKAHGFTAIRG